VWECPYSRSKDESKDEILPLHSHHFDIVVTRNCDIEHPVIKFRILTSHIHSMKINIHIHTHANANMWVQGKSTYIRKRSNVHILTLLTAIEDNSTRVYIVENCHRSPENVQLYVSLFYVSCYIEFLINKVKISDQSRTI